MRLILIFLLLFIPSICLADTFGNDGDWSTDYVSTGFENIILGAPFEAPASGTLNSIKVWLLNPSTAFQVKSVVYHDNSGTWDLIAETTEQEIPKDPAGGDPHLHTFTLDSESITSGETYAPAIWAEANGFFNITMLYDSSAPAAGREFSGLYFDSETYNGFPNPGGGSIINEGGNAAAIYVDYTPSAVASAPQIIIIQD